MTRIQFEEAYTAHAALMQDDAIIDRLVKWAQTCYEAIVAGGIIFFAGNGGSFADAQHLAAELTGKMGRLRGPLAGLALGTNSSSMSAIANDFGYEEVFSRECRALANPHSVVVVLSTSGNSPSIVHLVAEAQQMGLSVMGLTGARGGRLAQICEVIQVPTDRTERAQELHILVGHTLCLLIEDLIFSVAGE